MATGEDYRYPETEGGRRNAVTRLMNRYMDQVMYAANRDSQVYTTFFEVGQLLKPVTAFFQPGIMMKVLMRSIQRK